MRTSLLILILILATAGGAAYYTTHVTASSPAGFRTVAVKRDTVLSTITATGTVEPEEVINVGAQVAGRIEEFGPDPKSPSKYVDYGSVVEKDTILAKIDATAYEAALEEARASLLRSEADLLQLQAKAENAETEWKRAQSLRPSKAIADTDYDTAVANYKAAKANVAVGAATIRQNKAALRMAEVNLGYTTIKSPVRGTVIDRRVNIGQTVVASLNAPSLFLIAKDLKRMQVWTSVNEADIGQIRVDMPVRFTVDAYPGQTFRGVVTQKRMNATMTQNVVTYTVVVTTDNSSGKLIPYLTASVKFEVDKRANVLMVPNVALRWKPEPSQIDPAASTESFSVSSATTTDAALHADNAIDREADDQSADDDPVKQKERGTVWVVTDRGLVRPIQVTLGISDGTNTEIRGDGIDAGLPVVVGEKGDGESEGAPGNADKTTNPFLPQMPKNKRPPPGPM